MAIVKCKECGSQVSSKASACPGCGAPVTSARIVIKAVFRYSMYAMFALILFVVLKVSFTTTSALQSMN